jgi:hypothetical protein
VLAEGDKMRRGRRERGRTNPCDLRAKEERNIEGSAGDPMIEEKSKEP